MDIIFKTFILEPLVLILYFPLWWYSKGLVKFFNFLRRTILEISNPIVLKILIANLFKPMYGDYSREGRIISFFMRVIHLSFYIFKIILASFICLIIFIFYLILLPLIFYKIICYLFNFCHYFLIYPII